MELWKEICRFHNFYKTSGNWSIYYTINSWFLISWRFIDLRWKFVHEPEPSPRKIRSGDFARAIREKMEADRWRSIDQGARSGGNYTNGSRRLIFVRARKWSRAPCLVEGVACRRKPKIVIAGLAARCTPRRNLQYELIREKGAGAVTPINLEKGVSRTATARPRPDRRPCAMLWECDRRWERWFTLAVEESSRIFK